MKTGEIWNQRSDNTMSGYPQVIKIIKIYMYYLHGAPPEIPNGEIEMVEFEPVSESVSNITGCRRDLFLTIFEKDYNESRD